MILLDSTLSSVDFMSLVSEGRSLCINIHDIQDDECHLNYCNTLIGTKVDRVLAISGRFNIHHPCISVDYPNIITLSDPDHLWLSLCNHIIWLDNIKTTYETNYTTDFLSRNLRCQQLWVEGKLANFWHQPLDNQYEGLVQTKNLTQRIFYIAGKDGVNFLSSMTKDSIEDLFYRRSDKLMNCDTVEHDYLFARVIDALLWYKLIPNYDL